MEGSAAKPVKRERTLTESQMFEDDPRDEPEDIDEEEEGWSDIPDEQDPDMEQRYQEERKPWLSRRKPVKQAFPEGGGDLAEFFGDVDAPQQIAICRAYASYLAAQSRARKPGLPPTYIKRSRQ